MTDLQITADGSELAADWVEANPETRGAVQAALPLSGDVARWGDELYVDVPVEEPPEETTETVPVGAVAYWPAGNALCLFWGPTPASESEKPRAAGPVAVLAQIGDVSPLSDLEGAATVRVEPG